MAKTSKKTEDIKVTSVDIKRALALYRPKDYFLTEVKNGSTYFPPAQGLLKFDGVGIRRSYTQPCITIYEIKVSRGDFLQDPKWKLYRQYCHEFYFVVPKGMVDKSELPEDVGLIYYYPDTGKLLTKQKSKYIQCENPHEMYEYIIYSRLTQEHPFYESRAEYAKAYLEDQAYKRDIGKQLGSKMAKEMQKMQEDLEAFQTFKSGQKIELYKGAMEFLRERGINSWDIETKEDMKKTLSDLVGGGCSKDLLVHMKRELGYVISDIDKIIGEEIVEEDT